MRPTPILHCRSLSGQGFHLDLILFAFSSAKAFRIDDFQWQIILQANNPSVFDLKWSRLTGSAWSNSEGLSKSGTAQFVFFLMCWNDISLSKSTPQQLKTKIQQWKQNRTIGAVRQITHNLWWFFLAGDANEKWLKLVCVGTGGGLKECFFS